MALSLEQFKQLDAQGFSPEEIAGFEARHKAEGGIQGVPQSFQPPEPSNNPIMKGLDYLLPQGLTGRKYAPDTFNIYGDVLQRPMSAVSALVQGKNPLQGYISPSSIPPTAQGLDEIAKQNQPQPTNKLQAIMQVAPSALKGAFTDVVSNPLTYSGGAINQALKSPMLNEGMGIVKQYANPIIQKVAPILEKAAGNIFSPVTNLAQGLLKTSEGNSVNFAQDVRNAFIQAHTDKVAQFGGDVEKLAQANPTKTTSLRNLVNNLNENMKDMAPEAKSAFRNNPILGKMLKNPGLADNVTLQDAQGIINYMNKGVPANIKYQHLDIMDTLNQVKAAQLDAFPQMADVRADYSNFINPYNRLKAKFKLYNVLDQVSGGFGGPVERGDVNKVFQPEVQSYPPKPNMIQEMAGYKSAKSLKEGVSGVAKKVGLVGLLGTAGYGGYRVGKAILP